MYTRRSPKLELREDRCHIPDGESLCDQQPFLRSLPMDFEQRYRFELARTSGQLANAFSPEHMAFALGQVSAVHVLPPLTELENGSELLSYRVMLRDRMDPDLIVELVKILTQEAAHMNWEKIDATSYACVIGAGVAACLDVHRGEESLYLRYTNALAHDLRQARHAAELPRSLLFLQTALHERFDALLEKARAQTWYWLVG